MLFTHISIGSIINCLNKFGLFVFRHFHFPTLFSLFQGNDESFLQKLNSHHGKSSCFVKSKSLSRASFGVVHFAGTIQYDVRGKTTGQLNKTFTLIIYKLGSCLSANTRKNTIKSP